MAVSVLEHPRDFGLGNDFPEETRALSDYEFRHEVAPAFLKNLSAGFELAVEGWARFTRYTKAQAYLGHFQITPEFMHACLERCGELEIFPASEIVSGSVPKPKRPEAPKPAPDPRAHAKTIADLMEQTASTSPVWKKYVEQGFEAEFVRMFEGWCDSMRQNFGFSFPVERLGKKAAAFLERNSLSPFVHASWDRIRVAFVKSGDFPNHMLTDQERLSLLVDEDPRSTSDYAFRREIGRRGQGLMDERPPLPPHK